MTISLYAASVPVFKQMLNALSDVLHKAEAHATAKNIEPNALLQARLYPDMFPLVRQVQIAVDFAKGVSARLAEVELPKYDDTEVTFADLQALEQHLHHAETRVDLVEDLAVVQVRRLRDQQKPHVGAEATDLRNRLNRQTLTPQEPRTAEHPQALVPDNGQAEQAAADHTPMAFRDLSIRFWHHHSAADYTPADLLAFLAQQAPSEGGSTV